MDNLKDLFKPQVEKVTKEEEKRLSVLADYARLCLSNPDFKVYREQYQKAEAGMLDALIKYTSIFLREDKGDLNKYAVTMIRYITRIEDIRTLLSTVEKDSKKGQRGKKDEEDA